MAALFHLDYHRMIARNITIVLIIFAGLALMAWNVLFPPEQPSEPLVVFAATSLTDAFGEINEAFETQHPNVRIALNTAGSSTLAAQIAEGAPADVFASADAQQMTAAAQSGRLSSDGDIFTTNTLVLAVPADNPAGITSLQDLARPGVLLVLAAQEVPVRVYTDQLLARLASDPAYGEAYRTAVLANVASEELNTRQVAAKLALGEADAGIIYQTDIRPDMADQITALPIPAAVNITAAYPIAAVKGSADPALARLYIDFVLSSKGQAILAQWGFGPLTQP